MIRKMSGAKRLKLILLLTVLLGLLIFILSAKNIQPNNQETVTNPTNKTITKTELETNFDKFKAEEARQKSIEELEKLAKEKVRLERLANPELVTSELTRVGKLITYEGKAKYEDKIIEKGFLNKRELFVDITYKFGMSIDLHEVKVVLIDGDKITISVPKDKVKLEYVSNIKEETLINGYKSRFAKQFTPEEVNYIINYAKGKTEEKLNAMDDLFFQAHENAKNELGNLIVALGYHRVRFVD